MVAHRKNGQSIIESCLAIFLICLVFVGIFQVSQIYAAREILHYSAGRAARAKTVGFNRWMVNKVARAGAIANAGKLVEPDFDYSDPALQTAVDTYLPDPANGGSRRPGRLWDDVLGGVLQPPSAQVDLEIARIPEYLWAPSASQAKYILDYEDWDSITVQDLTPSGPDVVGTLAHVKAGQLYPLKAPAHRAFYDADTIALEGEAYIDNHYPLFLEDMNW